VKKNPTIKLTLSKETILELRDRDNALREVAGAGPTGFVWCIYPDTK